MIQEPRAQVLGQQSTQQQSMGVSIEEVVSMLMQGTSPEELVQRGVPVEMIKQAIEFIMQQEGQQQVQPQQDPMANTLG